MTEKEILQEVRRVCDNTLKLIQKQPNKDEMKNLIRESIDAHYDRCPAAQAIDRLKEKTAENTAVVKLMSKAAKARDSITPKSKGDFSGWVKLGLIVASAIASAFGINLAVN